MTTGAVALQHPSPTFHNVQGVICREVQNVLPIVGTLAVLEATADAQEQLVDEALALDGEQSTDGEKRIKEGDPYGAVLWPAAWATANFLLTKPNFINNLSSMSVLELGTGTGLVSLAVAMAGARRVLATDYEPLALSLVDYAAKNLENSIQIPIEKQLLDLCDLGTPLPKGFDLVVAADIMYEPKTGMAMAHRVVEALQNNSQVVVGDSPGRAGRPVFLRTLQDLGVRGEFEDAIGMTCSGPRHDLICGKDSKSVSDVPQELPVAILHLEPKSLQKIR
ncbi:methyltransferase type 11 domain containing protein [Nitzschia inconspicua]|uniref:Methyltransferase type 11 domain containing protein n=1 Tax=Nitzschia inconspicua TaxID=303405 RepID=A0A9K3PPP8_9STRA|nr:methyltransferase type 11 domain containing protein [Nitzschia inconspicua]